MSDRFRQARTALLRFLEISRSSRAAVIVALAFVAITGLFLVPVQPWILDLLFVINIVLSLTILLRGVFARDATEMFSFPLFLLLTTLFRLGLNVSSTRLILSRGNEGSDAAGRVIEAFGLFVAEGDVVVGAIVFAVIGLVNFLVITKGAGRVAEVAARFSLDSLPGKQLAIDADVRSGSISREEAEARRALLGRESQFFGSMDGAMKFVQGDAIACLLIVVLNAVGGVAVGTLLREMPLGDAIGTYGILALGDGLVSILPALLVSVSAGVVVTNVGGHREGAAGDELVPQLLADPSSLFLVGGSIVLLSVLPGFPFAPFALVGLSILLFAVRSFQQRAEDRSPAGTGMAAISPLVIELSPDLAAEWAALGEANSVTPGQYAERVRQEILGEQGILMPKLAMRENGALPAGSYRVFIRGEEVRNGECSARATFVALPPQALRAFGLQPAGEQVHPRDGRRSAWVNEEAPLEFLSPLNVQSLRPHEFLVHEVYGAALDMSDELFGVEEAKTLTSELRKTAPQVVEEVIGKGIVSILELTRLLRELLSEGVPIRDLKLILEGVAEFSCLRQPGEDRQEWLEALHEFVRARLWRGLLRPLLGPGDKLRVFVLSQESEAEIRAAAGLWDRAKGRPPLDPEVEAPLRESLGAGLWRLRERGALPLVVLCPRDVRAAVQSIIGRESRGYSRVRTLAYEEMRENVASECIGVLG